MLTACAIPAHVHSTKKENVLGAQLKASGGEAQGSGGGVCVSSKLGTKVVVN